MTWSMFNVQERDVIIHIVQEET